MNSRYRYSPCSFKSTSKADLRACIIERMKCCPIVIPIPCLPHVPVKHNKCEVICNNICGNFLLQDVFSVSEVWEESVSKAITSNVTVFNSAHSTSAVAVVIARNVQDPVTFTVQPGNSISKTVEDAKSVTIRRIDAGRADGNFCIDVCFLVDCDRKI